VVLEHCQKHIRLIIYIGLVAATFVAYEPMRHNGFVNYDDTIYVTKNPNINEGLTRESVILAFTKPHAANWHPLTTLNHMLDCRLFGLEPFWHHLVSLMFHIVNTLLLFWILTNMTGSTPDNDIRGQASSPQAGATWASAFAAAVFALHPFQVESVAWVSERKTVVSGLFWLLTIAAYIWYTKRSSTRRYILLFLVYGLCIMTKPVVVTLPFVLLLLDYWPLERVKWGGDTERTNSIRWLVIEKIPLLVLSAILSATTLIVQHSGGTVATLKSVSFDYRIANMFVSYIRYIGKMIWPSGLAVLYPLPLTNVLKSIAVVCALLFVLISVLSIYIGRRRRYIAVGWLWYVGTLVPMIGLVQVGAQAMANRYMYISILGLLIIIGWTVKDLIANRPRWRAITAVGAGAALISAVILTRMQVRHWQNNRTLFEHTLSVTRDNDIAEYGYGCALSEEGRLSEAVLHLSKAVQIYPENSDARKSLGMIFLKQGKHNEATACFNELIKRKPDSAEGYYSMGLVLGMQKKYDDAAKYLAKALELNPKYPDAHNKMGAALLVMRKTDEALVYLNEALRISANDAEVYINLGTAYNQLGNYELAIQNWNRALELKPDSAEVLNNLAWLYATVGDSSVQDANKAIELAERACELTGHKKAEFLDTLAAAYAAGGRFDEAKATAEKALDAAKAAKQEDLAGRIENRLQLYQEGRRYLPK